MKFDWLIVLENLRRGIMVTGVTLEGPEEPRILQGEHTDRAVVDSLKEKLLNREMFHGQTWNYRKSGEPFLMNWYCYAVYGERPNPIYYVAEQEDVTELTSLRLKERLMVNPHDPDALRFFSVLEGWKSSQERT